MSKKRSAGGAAASGGFDFQGRVAAWMAVQILAEQDVSLSWRLPASITAEWLRCETEEPVDDVLVATSATGFVFGQVKHALNLSMASNSELASVLHQFVRQCLAHTTIEHGNKEWQRPLDIARDRLVLILGSGAASTIHHDLQAVMRRAAGLASSQPLHSAAVNIKEHHALKVAIGHIQVAWQSTLGTRPTDDDVRQILSLCHVQVLDVDAGGREEIEAKNLLRASILADPLQADAAWAVLVSFCTGLATSRSGADRHLLQRALLGAGIAVQAPRSYSRDIRRLQDYSKRIFTLLRDLTLIRVGSEEVKIERRFNHELRRMSGEGHFLMVGEPGAGKSGALHDLATSLTSNRDVLFLAVDRLAAASLTELRNELRLDHELPDVLANWPGADTAFLVIDALDAARTEPSALALRDLITLIIQEAGRWRVITSIRKFDLRYSPRLKELFRGEATSEFVEAEFRGIRHFSVRTMSPEELDQIEPQSPRLYSLVRKATPELLQLLSVPFNLRLVADLIAGGVELASLTPLRTQLELLDRYWQHRVIRGDGQDDAREDVLRRACASMVQQRQLRVARAEIADATPGPWLVDLLSEHVLAEWQPSPELAPDRYVITFSHHVLFDYAVERLLLRVAPAALVTRLAADRDQVLVLRPSLELHFEHLWDQESAARSQFWKLVFELAQAGEIPEIGKVIGPAVAASRGTMLADLEWLCSAMESPDGSGQSTADAVLRHLIGALLARAEEGQAIVGPGAGPWCDLLERASRSLQGPLVYTLRPLLFRICQSPTMLTPDQMSNAGKAARRALEFAWQLSPRDSSLVIHGLDCVCQTFESNRADSAALIRRALQSNHILSFGFEELPWLARRARQLVQLDSGLVQEIYEATFAHQEQSTEPTAMVSSRILPLQSHKRQDYAMALYELAATFPSFLEHAPHHAVRALISAMESFVAHEHDRGRAVESVFDFNGKEARLRSDLSVIWDMREGGSHQDAIKMLDAFERHLGSIGTDSGKAEQLRVIIAVVVENNRLASVWRRLLRVGARLPSVVGRELLPLATAQPILTFLDTRYLAGEYLKAVFQGLTPGERERIERALVAIPGSAEVYENGEGDRDRLLGCLPASALVTSEAKDLVAAMERSGELRPNVPDFEMSEVTHRAVRDEDHLREAGVPLEIDANRRLLALKEPLKNFAELYRNQSPPTGEVTAIVPSLRALADALSQAQAVGVHSDVQTLAWDAIAGACTRIAVSDGFTCGNEIGALVTSILLQSGRHSEPAPRPELDAQFDKFPSWGSPAPRIVAAQGLMYLARIPSCTTDELLREIEHLSHDPVPAVRFQIAIMLTNLYDSAPDLMWRLLEYFGNEETSEGVLVWLLDNPLQRLGGRHPRRVTELAMRILGRVQEPPPGPAVHEAVVNLFAQLYIWLNDETSGNYVLKLAMEAPRRADEADVLLRVIRTPLRHGRADSGNEEEAAVRDRAWTLISRLVFATKQALSELEALHPAVSVDRWPEHDQASLRSLVRLVDHVGTELYFASGAYGLTSHAGGDEPVGEPERKRFYREAKEVLDELACIGLASLAHRLLETLESFIPFDPADVFLRVSRVVRGGQRGGYQFESMAADLLVRLVERYLAEYRPIFRDNEACRGALLEVLDIFVKVGWPSARRLTYHLEDIFR